MKNIFKKSKIKTLILSLFLVMGVFFVSACSYSDRVPTEEEGGTQFIAGIDGFKINYRPEIFEVSDFYYNFSLELLIQLSNMFGNADFERVEEVIVVDPTSPQGYTYDVIPFVYEQYLNYAEELDANLSYKDFEESKTVFFLDDIRSSAYIHLYEGESIEDFNQNEYVYFAKSNNDAHSWSWTHKIEEDNTHGYDPVGNDPKVMGLIFGDYASSPRLARFVFDWFSITSFRNERNNYYNFYAQTYAKALQVAILEILLERQPTVFEFDFNTDQVSPNPDTLLGNGQTEGLKLDYKKYVEEIGISESSRNQIANYIIENVIGNAKYESADSHFTKQDYEFIVKDLILEGTLQNYHFSDENAEIVNDQNLGRVYDVYPAVVVQDFSAYSLFVQSEDSRAFAHIPSGRYRSVVLMPSKTDYLYTLMFYIAANREFNVNLHYRFYDAEKDILFESSVGTVRTYKESTFSFTESNYVGLLFEDEKGDESLYKMTKFNNQIGGGILNAALPKTMNAEMNEYYEESSKGGFGLNHEKFKEDGSSFFEIIFDTDSGDQTQDTMFKVGIQGVWARDPEEFYR